MSTSVEFRPATAYSLQRIAALFTACYEDYKYPVNVDAGQLAGRLRDEGIDLSSSFVLLDGRSEAGLVLLARRGAQVWCGGFGVIRPHRGKGLGRVLATEMVARARASGAGRLVLEVLCSNDAARHLYEVAGLRTERELMVLSWSAPSVRPPASQAAQAPACDPSWLAALAGSPGLRSACWQRSPASLLSRSGLVRLSTDANGTSQAALALAVLPGRSARIIAIEADNSSAAQHVLRLAQAQFDRIGVVNEPTDSPWLPALFATGFSKTDQQYEMAMDLGA